MMNQELEPQENRAAPALTALIRGEMAGQGALSWARFMELALYAPGLGYYERGGPTIGGRGDFQTSVSVGSLFGELLAFQFAEWFHEQGLPTAGPEGQRSLQIVEAGAHDGRLAADVLDWMRRQRSELFTSLDYWIIEPSTQRQTWQETTLAHFAPRVRWATSWDKIPSSAHRIVYCNELLDAMPVHRLGWDATVRRWFEWGVAWNGTRFTWQRLVKPPDPSLLETVMDAGFPLSALLPVLPDGYIVETSPKALQWWHAAATALQTGRLLAIDYGLTAEELFIPERMGGTLRGYCQHHHSDDLLAHPGEQDLTAHVNFTAFVRTGEAAGLKTDGLFSPSQFFTTAAARAWAAPESFGEWTQPRTRQFQTLTHPDHFGRSFRALVQSRTHPAAILPGS